MPMARDRDKEWSTSEITVGNSTQFGDFWSDGETIWIAHFIDNALYAFNMETKQRTPSRDILIYSHGHNFISNIWSDGTTIWVASARNNKVHAYSLADGTPDPDQEFNDRDTDNTSPFDLWSDGTTMWIMDSGDEKIYAYDMVTREPDADKDIDAPATDELAIFGDGTIIWTSDYRGAKLFSYNLPESDDASLRRLTIDGQAIRSLPSDSASYMHAVSHTTSQVTVEAVVRNIFASASYSGADADDTADGFQVDLDEGTNAVTITVTAADDSTETYTLTLNRGSDDDYAWKAVDDIYSIADAGRSRRDDTPHSYGIWTDGTTLWTVNSSDATLYAYSVSTKERTPDHDCTLGGAPTQDETTRPWDMWSDGTTLWLSDHSQ